MVRVVAVLLVLLIAQASSAQLTSTLSGSVIDASSLRALQGAVVEIPLADTLLIATTDADGAYMFAAVPTGIHAVRVRHDGHEAALVPEVWIRAGKSEVVDVALRSSVKQLAEVAVEARAPRAMSTIGTHALTVEQSLRYPATFFDPARLATTRPGVAATNDQANHMSIRGNSPASNAYLLEGAEIVNPNHLSNAGTASDLPVLSGGGVSILSAQMLGTSQLLTGGSNAAYGNALGGIMDMRLRRGATDGQAFTVQAGLLGIDLSTEGPFTKDGRASYLVNYRYSTLGLLSAMGVDLGDEAITFQDLSFHVSVPMARGSISLFGLGGTSSNIFEAKDSTEWEYDKDSQNIDYTAQVGAAGGTLRLALGRQAVWTTTAAISENNQLREADGIKAPSFDFQERDELNERKLSVVSNVRGRRGARFTYEIGGTAMERTVVKDVLLEEITVGWLVRPYARAGYDLSERVHAELGIAHAHYTANGNAVPEPRLSLRWDVGEHAALSLAAGQRSQLPNVQSYSVGPRNSFWDNSEIGPDRMQELVLGYDHALRPRLLLHVEAYHQQRDDVAVGDATYFVPPQNEDGSMANAWDVPLLMALRPDGEVRNSGLEISLAHNFHNGWYYQANGTGMSATYTDINGVERGARWNTGAIGNLLMGREFAKQKEDATRTWGVNMRANVTGGQRRTPIDVNWSFITGGTVYDAEMPFSKMWGTYYRIDVRVYLKREHRGRTGMWALDLQNAINAQNAAYRYYDRRRNEVVTKYQLGLIPNLSYRIEF